MKLLAKLLLTIQIVVLLLTKGQAVNWSNGNWANGCDFHGNDLSNGQVPSEKCGGLCAQTSGCTHFTWTTYNGGTCWMKSGSASKADAFDTNDNSMVCGVLNDQPNNGNGINWTGDWAFNCDWIGNDLSNAQIPGDQCGGRCAQTSGCTHFTWTTYNGGTCWMKSGTVSKSDAFRTNDNTMVCGVASGSNPAPPNPAQFTITNKCSYDIYVGAWGNSNINPGWAPNNGGWKLSPGESTNANAPKDLKDARFWGRTGCQNVNGQFICETGRCAPSVQCGRTTGEPPATLAEFTLNGGPNGDQHHFDLSLVDGYNVQMSIIVKSPNNKYGFSCKSLRCVSDLNRICPPELQKKNSAGQVVACYSACAKYHTPESCCTGAFNLPTTCPGSSYDRIFKQACPDAYSYAYDDKSALVQCSNTGYEIQFC